MTRHFALLDLVENLKTEWKSILHPIAQKYSHEIDTKINDDINKNVKIFPSFDRILKTFDLFDPKDLKVVIIGQDVYHKENLATGLCFSASSDVSCPASLKNIFKEIKDDFGIDRKNNDLEDWANQGVLMLNVALTVQEGKAGSHLSIWRAFTSDIIKYIGENMEDIVFLLWGNFAKNYKSFLPENRHYCLLHSHPSPLSTKPFIGCRHFSKCNLYLQQKGKSTIKWTEMD